MAFAALTKKVIAEVYKDIVKTDPKAAQSLLEKAETYKQRLNTLAGLEAGGNHNLYETEKGNFIKKLKEDSKKTH